MYVLVLCRDRLEQLKCTWFEWFLSSFSFFSKKMIRKPALAISFSLLVVFASDWCSKYFWDKILDLFQENSALGRFNIYNFHHSSVINKLAVTMSKSSSSTNRRSKLGRLSRLVQKCLRQMSTWIRWRLGTVRRPVALRFLNQSAFLAATVSEDLRTSQSWTEPDPTGAVSSGTKTD